jgi:hypothetical protein
MNEPKNETPNVPVQANSGPVSKVQKVRSSRYEWEGKGNNENEKAAGASVASRRSLLASAGSLLKKFFWAIVDQAIAAFSIMTTIPVPARLDRLV